MAITRSEAVHGLFFYKRKDKSIVREKFTLLLYVLYVVVCFSLSDNIFDQQIKRNRLGPWGFFAEYWVFEVWLP